MNYLIKASSDLDGYPPFDRTKDIMPFDVGLDIGLAYKVNKHISIEARYGHGLTSVEYRNYGLTRYKGYNRVAQLGIAYRFSR